MAVAVVFRPCIYEVNHAGPCVGPDGQWWLEQPSDPGVSYSYIHLGGWLHDENGGTI